MRAQNMQLVGRAARRERSRWAFYFIAMDGGRSRPSVAFAALGLLPVVYAENAGAIFGGAWMACIRQNERPLPSIATRPSDGQLRKAGHLR